MEVACKLTVAKALRPPDRGGGITSTIQCLIDAMPAAIVILADDLSILQSNRRWHDLFEQESDPISDCGIGDPYCDFALKLWEFSPVSPKQVARELKIVAAGEKGGASLTAETTLSDGVHHWAISIFPLKIDNRVRIIVSHEDVTTTVRLTEERRTRATELLTAQIEDRRHLGRELHDSTAQHLVAMSLVLIGLQPPYGSSAISEAVAELKSLVSQVTQEVRIYSYLLHPPELAGVGIARALEDYVKGFVRRTGLPVSFEWNVAQSHRLVSAEVAILRIVQEALGNVHRHADAAQAWVLGNQTDNEFSLVIADSGRGIDPTAAETGVGIASMRARAAELGGTLSIHGSTTGTLVIAHLPLAPAA